MWGVWTEEDTGRTSQYWRNWMVGLEWWTGRSFCCVYLKKTWRTGGSRLKGGTAGSNLKIFLLCLPASGVAGCLIWLEGNKEHTWRTGGSRLNGATGWMSLKVILLCLPDTGIRVPGLNGSEEDTGELLEDLDLMEGLDGWTGRSFYCVYLPQELQVTWSDWKGLRNILEELEELDGMEGLLDGWTWISVHFAYLPEELQSALSGSDWGKLEKLEEQEEMKGLEEWTWRSFYGVYLVQDW